MSSTAGTSSTERNKHSSNAQCYEDIDIDVTKDELTRIEHALKKKEFRKLFQDYVDEIQDPANRKKYEEEIIQLEAERGVTVTFVHPEPGFVVKTSVDGVLKCFVNIAKSEVLQTPRYVGGENSETGERGQQWSVPLAQTGGRDDLDAHNKRCRVYDVIFHPDALQLSERNNAFRKLIIDTALDAVESEFKVRLDRNNLKFPNLKYKGIARAVVIRKLAECPPAGASEPHPLDDIYPPRPAEAAEPRVHPQKQHSTVEQKSEFTVPRYVIKHRRDVDLAEYTDELDSRLNLTVPRMLVVEIDLPLLASTAECNLDVTPESVYLLSELPGAKYRLQLDLPFTVNEKNSSAHFVTDTRVLSIELPVVQRSVAEQRSMHNTLLHLSREDSGVESDMREDMTSNHSASPVDELPDVEEDTGDSLLVEWTTEAKNRDDDGTTKADDTANSLAAGPFLKPSRQYLFPAKFDCNVLDNVMSLVLDVRHVLPESVQISQHAYDVHVKFNAVGCGFFPTHYAFYLQLAVDKDVRIESAQGEAWENNVVLNVNLATSGENVHKYWAGIDVSDLKEYKVRGKFHVARTSRQRNKLPPAPLAMKLSSSLNVSVERSECERSLEIEIKPREQHSTGAANTTEDEEHGGSNSGADGSNAQRKMNKKQRKKNKKHRSLSESMCDDIYKALRRHQQETEQMQKQQQRQPPQKQALESNDNSASHHSTPNKLPATQSMAVPMAANQNDGNGAQQRKQRSYSECRDSLIGSSAASAALPASSGSSAKGILKPYSRYEQARPSISDSCSSIDDYASSSYSCSMDAGAAHSLRFSQLFSDIPEENSTAGLSESCKKTVRFNEVIMKQVFRIDSSILGQRKKNQKRRDRKQRAWQRRHSEGDSADYEEHDKPVDLQPTNVQYFKMKGRDEHNRNMVSDKRAQHDSGLDLSASCDNASDGVRGSGGRALSKAANIDGKMLRSRSEADACASDVDAAKNTMMFDMDM